MIETNYAVKPGKSPSLTGSKVNKAQPAFTGSASMTEQITNYLPHAKTIKHMENLKWLKGEIGGILITALGTGLVAPIFIGFNPFTRPPKDATEEQKNDFDNTKKYTAMRQPISAVLAILFQASVQKYIDKGLDAVFNNKNIAKYGSIYVDQQDLNTETYIKAQVKKKMAEEGREKPSWFKALFNKEAKEARAKYTVDFDAQVKAEQKRQIEAIAAKFESSKGLIQVGERFMDHKTVAELVNSQIADYISDAEKLKKSPEKIAFYKKRAELLMTNKEHLESIFAETAETRAKIAQAKEGSAEIKALYNELTQTIQKLKAREQNVEIKKLLQEILDKPEDLRANRIQRTLDRFGKINALLPEGTPFSADAYETALIHRNNVLDKKVTQLTGCKIDNLAASDRSTIENVIERIAKILSFENEAETSTARAVLKDTDTFGESLKAIRTKVYKDVANKYKKLVSNHYKSWNQFTKIGVGVFITLPITCTALNWVYPRFMEIFFPKLAGTKKAQQSAQQDKKAGGDK